MAKYIDYIIQRKYYKYIDTSFTPPTLTASNNGAMGGDKFGVTASNTFGAWYGWCVFDGVTSGTYTGWVSTVIPCYLDIYNPEPIKITKMSVLNSYNSTGYGIASGYISVSDDGTNWEQIATYTNNDGSILALWDIDLSNNTGYHKYYRLGVSTKLATYIGIEELYLTATERKAIESTINDYDFYEDVNVYLATKENNNYYCAEA